MTSRNASMNHGVAPAMQLLVQCNMLNLKRFPHRFPDRIWPLMEYWTIQGGTSVLLQLAGLPEPALCQYGKSMVRTVKMTFTLDNDTATRLDRTALRLGLTKSAVVREPVAEDAPRAWGLFRGVRAPRGREVDLAIAACAIRWNAALWTLNVKDFRDVPGLDLFESR